MNPPTLTWISESALRVGLGDAIGDAAHDRVRAAMEALADFSIDGLVDITPAYTTIVLTFDTTRLEPREVESTINAALARPRRPLAAATREVRVPVCYVEDFAPDLNEVGALLGLAPARVVELHAAGEYTVHCVGFAPGFAYLAGLDTTLEVPRLSSPRARVPAGSVAIAGGQTGVYPRATPGGWRIIGRTPMEMFDAKRERPCTLMMGDRVRFEPITREQFERLHTGRG